MSSTCSQTSAPGFSFGFKKNEKQSPGDCLSSSKNGPFVGSHILLWSSNNVFMNIEHFLENFLFNGFLLSLSETQKFYKFASRLLSLSLKLTDRSGDFHSEGCIRYLFLDRSLSEQRAPWAPGDVQFSFYPDCVGNPVPVRVQYLVNSLNVVDTVFVSFRVTTDPHCGWWPALFQPCPHHEGRAEIS